MVSHSFNGSLAKGNSRLMLASEDTLSCQQHSVKKMKVLLCIRINMLLVAVYFWIQQILINVSPQPLVPITTSVEGHPSLIQKKKKRPWKVNEVLVHGGEKNILIQLVLSMPGLWWERCYTIERLTDGVTDRVLTVAHGHGKPSKCSVAVLFPLMLFY